MPNRFKNNQQPVGHVVPLSRAMLGKFGPKDILRQQARKNKKKKSDNWEKNSVNKSKNNYIVNYDKPHMLKVEFIGSLDEYNEMESILSSP